MATRYRKPKKSNAPLWIVLGCVGAIGASIGIYFMVKGSGKSSSSGKPSSTDEVPGFVRAGIDTSNVENTRAWASAAVKQLKDADARKTDAEMRRVEKELKDALLGKKIRWSFPVEAVTENEVKLDTFFGTKAGTFAGDDPQLKGRPLRKLYFRAYIGSEKDEVKIGDEVSATEAKRLHKGDQWTLTRTVTEVTVEKVNKQWLSVSSYTDVVDEMDAYCITLIMERK